jgi:hypothetical protein
VVLAQASIRRQKHTSGGKDTRSLNAAPYQFICLRRLDYDHLCVAQRVIDHPWTPHVSCVSPQTGAATTAEYSMTRQDMMRGWRMPRHDQPTKDADQQRYDGGAAVRP